jgi:hypothetical protein
VGVPASGQEIIYPAADGGGDLRGLTQAPVILLRVGRQPAGDFRPPGTWPKERGFRGF